LEESEFIQRLIKGDQVAFQKLVNEHQKMVFGLCFSYLNNFQDSEDTSQEVFIQVYKSIDGFKGESSLKTWVYRIVISKCHDFIKAKNRKKRFAFLTGYEEVEERWESNAQTPQKILENKEHMNLLHQAIEQLSEIQKTVFVLNHLHEKTNAEISDLLGISKSTVDSHIRRSKEKIRKLLRDILK
jgi:RNA polymerase sigma factor (sigma-70 family)